VAFFSLSYFLKFNGGVFKLWEHNKALKAEFKRRAVRRSYAKLTAFKSA
jgi:hypothetical protein